MYESSTSQLFRSTTGIQSGPDTFDESTFVMTFLAILGVTERLRSFILVLVVKAATEIIQSSRLKFLEKLLGNHFALLDVEDNTSWLLNRTAIAGLS